MSAGPRRHVVSAGVIIMIMAVTLVVVPLSAWSVAQTLRDATLEAPAPTPLIYDRQGRFLTEIATVAAPQDSQRDHGYWPVEQLPDRVVRATLALEDRRFYDHPGVDPRAVVRAFWQNLTQPRHRIGASTIAMQIARMQQPAPRTWWAKLREAAVALALTWRYDRAQLLAHYLRLVPYGNGSHGIAHAARWYFDKPADDLSWAEIALLSAIPQSPTFMNPLRPDGLARARRRGDRMLEELARQNVINDAELALARRQLTEMPPPHPPRRPDALHAVVRYESMAREGRLVPPVPSDPRIRASIDLDVQQQVMTLARRYLAAWNTAGAEQASVMVVDRRSGEVLADLGSIDYYDSPAGAIDFSRTQRSPGSTLKPSSMRSPSNADCCARPMSWPTCPTAPPASTTPMAIFGFAAAPGACQFSQRPGHQPAAPIGLDPTFRFLHELGVHDLDGSADTFGLSMAIGSLPTTLDRLVRAIWRSPTTAGSTIWSGIVVRGAASRRRCSRLTPPAWSHHFSQIRWRGCRAFRAMAPPNIRFRWR